jgi:hypothetical protein
VWRWSLPALLTNVIDFAVNDGVSRPKPAKMITFVSEPASTAVDNVLGQDG